MNLVELILDTSKIADHFHKTRTRNSVMNATTAELGELAEEVNIAEGASYKEAGPDGVKGEAIDLIISGLDLLYVDDRNVTEAELIAIARPKLEKWITKIMQAHGEGKLK
jgi:NTP pyrophosphatase (non-canonical NTP hydrolase)